MEGNIQSLGIDHMIAIESQRSNPRANKPSVCFTVYGFRHSSWWGLCVWCLYTHSSPCKGNESQIRSSGEDQGIDLYLQSMVRATAESLARSLLTIDGVCKMDTTMLCLCIFCLWMVYTCTRWLEEIKAYLKIKKKSSQTVWRSSCVYVIDLYSRSMVYRDGASIPNP